ncbi:MAG: hypothetical protein R2827_03990 [Bdellovibrionales bacterium]
MRPYTVIVTVRKEIRKKNSSAVLPEYSDRGVDKSQSLTVARRIGKSLSKRRKDANIIDEFRIF